MLYAMRLSLVIVIATFALAATYFSHLVSGDAPIPAHPVGAHTQAPHPTTVTQEAGAGQGHDGGQPQGYTCWTEHHAEDGGWDERLCRRDEAPAPTPAPYTCTSASSCAVLAAALNGPTAAPQTHAPRHRSTQPRAHTSRAPRSSTAQYEDQPGWSCATQGNHVCGTGVAGGPLADDSCPAGGVRVYGTPHGCRYR